MEDIINLRSEYAQLLPINSEYDKIASIFEKSYGSTNACISAIFKITNFETSERFEIQKNEITRKRKTEPDIINVFHGTTMASVRNIIATGFDPSYNTTSAFGIGTYASPCVRTALIYCKDVENPGSTSMVFLCRFLKGQFGKRTVGKINTELYDYSGDGHVIYVTPYAGGIIPDYLICYYSWDK